MKFILLALSLMTFEVLPTWRLLPVPHLTKQNLHAVCKLISKYFFFTILIMETLYVQMNAIKKNINFQVFALDLYIASFLVLFQYMVTGRDGRAGVPVL